MKETVILFSGSMPEAAMSGRKTQTRRLAKPQPDRYHDGEPYWFVGGYRAWKFRDCDDVLRKGGNDLKCPYGKPGDRLRFLGTWAVARECDHVKPSLLPFGVRMWSVYSGEPKPHWCGKSRPGRFMPKWMRSRMPLAEITGIRVERIQDITEEDAKSEGAEFGFWHSDQGVFASPVDEEDENNSSFRDGFGFLWESINGAGSWDENQFVWVIEFRRVKP